MMNKSNDTPAGYLNGPTVAELNLPRAYGGSTKASGREAVHFRAMYDQAASCGENTPQEVVLRRLGII